MSKPHARTGSNMRRNTLLKPWLLCGQSLIVAIAIIISSVQFYKISSQPDTQILIMLLPEWGIGTRFSCGGNESVREDKYLFFKVERHVYHQPL
jgi:hypothetical protein